MRAPFQVVSAALLIFAVFFSQAYPLLLPGDTLYWDMDLSESYSEEYSYKVNRTQKLLENVETDWLVAWREFLETLGFGDWPPFLNGTPEGEEPDGIDELEGTVELDNNRSKPLKLPVLYGLPYDDDGDQTPPLASPLVPTEEILLQAEIDALEALTANTVRGFSGTDGEFIDRLTFQVGLPIEEADGEDLTDDVDAFHALVVTDGMNAGHYSIRGIPGPNQTTVHALAWFNPGGETFTATIHHADTGFVDAGAPTILEDNGGVDFVVLFGGAGPVVGVTAEVPIGGPPVPVVARAAYRNARTARARVREAGARRRHTDAPKRQRGAARHRHGYVGVYGSR